MLTHQGSLRKEGLQENHKTLLSLLMVSYSSAAVVNSRSGDGKHPDGGAGD